MMKPNQKGAQHTDITEDELDVIKELVEESQMAVFPVSRQRRANTDMLKSLDQGDACNFSDLSSIMAVPPQEGAALEGLLRFTPATGVECMDSIPLAVSLLYEIANKVIVSDEKKEALAKKRAVKLSISQAFLTIFNNQYFNDKQMQERMSHKLQLDSVEEENEPVAAPIDPYCAHIKCKPRIRVRETKKPFKKSLQKKRMTPRVAMRSLEFNTVGSFGDLLRVRNANTRKLNSKGSINYGELSAHEGSFSDKSSFRRTGGAVRGGLSPRKTKSPYFKPIVQVPLNEYYSDYEDHSTGDFDQEGSDDWSALIIHRKKTMRANSLIEGGTRNFQLNRLNPMDMYGQQESRERLAHTMSAVKSHLQMKKLGDLAFASDAYILEKKSSERMSQEMAFLEARIKREQVTFKLDGPTYVTDEAPGFHVNKPHNKKMNRIIVQKPASVQGNFVKSSTHQQEQSTIQPNQNSISQIKGSVNVSQLQHLQNHQDYSRNHQNYAKGGGTTGAVTPSKVLQPRRYSGVNGIPPLPLPLQQSKSQKNTQSRNNEAQQDKSQTENQTPRKSNVLSQILKDSFLRKLQEIEQRGGRGSLMPSRLQINLHKRASQPMVGSIQPARVRFRSLKPNNFKIEADTFRLVPQTDVLKRGEDVDDYDPNHLSIQRLREAQNTVKTSRLENHGLNDDLFSHLLNVPTGSTGKKRANTLVKKGQTTMDVQEVQYFVEQSKDSPNEPNSMKNSSTTGNPTWHQSRRGITVENVERKSRRDSAVQFNSLPKLRTDPLSLKQLRTNDSSDPHLQVINQRNDDSENVSLRVGEPQKSSSYPILPGLPASAVPGGMKKAQSDKISLPSIYTPKSTLQKSHVQSQPMLTLNTKDRINRIKVNRTAKKALLTAVAPPKVHIEAVPLTPKSLRTNEQMFTPMANDMPTGASLSSNMQVLSQETQQMTLSRDIFSSQFSQRQPKPTKAFLLKTIEQKPTNFTSKVQINNLELTRQLVASSSLTSRGQATRKNHGLLLATRGRNNNSTRISQLGHSVPY